MAASQGDSAIPENKSSSAATDGAAKFEIRLDDASATSSYANFFRVIGTPEEVVFDLGIDLQPFAQQSRTVKTGHRAVMNYFTAKKFVAALSAAIQKHERTFGEIELDIAKRARPQTP